MQSALAAALLAAFLAGPGATADVWLPADGPALRWEAEPEQLWLRRTTGSVVELPWATTPKAEPLGPLDLVEEFRREQPWLSTAEEPDPEESLVLPGRQLLDPRRPSVLSSRRKQGAAAPDQLTDSRTQGNWAWLHLSEHLDNPAIRPVHGERALAADKTDVLHAGPLALYGQVRGGYLTLNSHKLLWTGATCIGCDIQPIDGAEIQLRGGTRASYLEDPNRPEYIPKAATRMLFELQARYNVLGPVNVEYQGMALPPLDPLDKNRVEQDLRLAVPVGAGQFRVGARHEWEERKVARPWSDGMQLYLGFGLQR